MITFIACYLSNHMHYTSLGGQSLYLVLFLQFFIFFNSSYLRLHFYWSLVFWVLIISTLDLLNVSPWGILASRKARCYSRSLRRFFARADVTLLGYTLFLSESNLIIELDELDCNFLNIRIVFFHNLLLLLISVPSAKQCSS